MFSTFIRRFSTCALIMILAAPSGADPRWWADDEPITSDGIEKAAPHLIHSTVSHDAGTQLYLVWQQRDPVEGDWEIYLSAYPRLSPPFPQSGPSRGFCEPVRLTDNRVDDTRPRIASREGHEPIFQVVFEREGDVILGSMAEAWPNAPTTLDELCPRLELLASELRFQRLNPEPGTARRPDIHAAGFTCGPLTCEPSFHVAWEDSRSGEWDVWVDRDAALDGSGYGNPLNLTDGAAVAGDSFWPAWSVAIQGTPSLSLSFVDAGTGEVSMLRSVDGGSTWSATGLPPGLPPVGDPAVLTSTAPFAGTGGDGYGPEIAATPAWRGWHLAAWTREDGDGAEADGFHTTEDPGVLDISWLEDRELPVGPAPLGSSRTAAVVQEEAAWVFWSSSVSGAGEVFLRGARLDETAAVPIDFDLFPLEPRRPEDSSLSEPIQLSHCEVDEETLDCVPTRTAGEAREVTATGAAWDYLGIHTVWVDTRSGATELYYKGPALQLPLRPEASAECAGPGEARIRLRFSTGVLDGRAETDELLRVFVYHGSDPGGIYQNADDPLVVVPDGTPRRHEVVIDGLPLGATWSVLPVGEDEGRSLSVWGFDPETDADSWPGEITLELPSAADCAPRVEVTGCELVPAVPECLDDPSTSDGELDFGEAFELRLTLANRGAIEALDYRAELTARGARVAAGDLRVPRIAPGGEVTVELRGVVDQEQAGAFQCGDLVDFRLDDPAAANGGPWPDDLLAACDLPVGGADGTCSTCAPAPLVVLGRCDLLDSTCGGSGNPLAVNPGERARFDLELVNIGAAPATDLTGDIALDWGGTEAAGFGAFGPVTLAEGASLRRVLELDVAEVCGDRIDVEVAGLEAEGGARTFPAILDACGARIGSNALTARHESVARRTVAIPDDGSAVRSALALRADRPRRVEGALLEVFGTMPEPADIEVLLELPGGGPPVDVTGSWGGAAAPAPEITEIYNEHPAGGPGDYVVLVRDAAVGGGEGTLLGSEMALEDVSAACEVCAAPAPVCAFLSEVPDLEAYRSDPGAWFRSDPGAEGQSLDVEPFSCSFQSGGRLPGVVPQGVPLVFYDLGLATETLRLRKDASRDPGDLVLTFGR